MSWFEMRDGKSNAGSRGVNTSRGRNSKAYRRDSTVIHPKQWRRATARISVSVSAIELLIIPILANFRNPHPDFVLEIAFEERLSDPVARRYDASRPCNRCGAPNRQDREEGSGTEAPQPGTVKTDQPVRWVSVALISVATAVLT